MKPRPYKSVSPSTVLLMRQIIVGTMIAAFFGMLIISVWYGTRVDAFTLATVTVKGGETIPHADIEAVVRSRLEGEYLKLVPRAFAFTYPYDDIVGSVREIKRIKNLSVVRVSGTEVLVEFDEYTPHALWCAGSDSDGCSFLDESGYSFSPAPSLSGGSFLRVASIGRAPGEHIQAFPVDEYQRLHELTTLLREKNWYVDRTEVDAAGDAFLRIAEGGEFKVTLKQTPKETVDNLLTILGSEKFAHIKPGNFEYVDLRFGDKVFVNEVTLETTASSTPTSNSSSTSQTTSNPQTNITTRTEPVPNTASTPAPDSGVTIPFDEPEE